MSARASTAPRPDARDGAFLWLAVVLTTLVAGQLALWLLHALGPSAVVEALRLSVVALVSQGAMFLCLWAGTRRLGLGLRAVAAVTPASVPAFVGAVSLLLGIVPLANGVAMLVRELVGSSPALEAVARTVTVASPLDLAVTLVVVGLVPAVVEELIFRGFLFTAFAEGSSLRAVVVTSLLFGLTHLDPAQAAGTAVLGLALGAARAASGSTLPSVVAHATYNGFVLLASRCGLELDWRAFLLVFVAGLLFTALASRARRGRVAS